MGAIDDFFNKSSFVAVSITGNAEVLPDVLFNQNVYIVDVIKRNTAVSITGKMYVKDGRNETLITTPVTIAVVLNNVWTIEGTVASGEWDGSDEIIVKMSITDVDAELQTYTYTLIGKE